MSNVPSDEFWDELEAEGLVEPVRKPQEVRLERRLTEARERHRQEIAAQRQRYLDQSREVLPNGEVLYLDAVPRIATPAEVRAHDGEGSGLTMFEGEELGVDDLLDPDAGSNRGPKAWPE